MDHILSLSRGKDSTAAIHVIVDILHWPLDRIIHAEVWATDTIHADLPPMVEYKARADRIIKEWWGIEVEHVRADRTYEECFYTKFGPESKRAGEIYGWPFLRGPWCNSWLKAEALNKIPSNAVQYWGIAADEPERIAKHKDKPNVKLPLVEAGWTEAMCRKWCEENGLLSPIYTDSARGGCWFCHNQGVDQLRLLRKNHPEYWALMLKWDKDSPVTFHPGRWRKINGAYVYEPGHTVYDYEHRFALEDVGQIMAGDARFRWDQILQTSLFLMAAPPRSHTPTNSMCERSAKED